MPCASEVALGALELDAEGRAIVVGGVAGVTGAALETVERALQVGDVALAVFCPLPRALRIGARRSEVGLDDLALVLLLAQGAHDLVGLVAQTLGVDLGRARRLLELGVAEREVLNLGAEEGRLGRRRLVLDGEVRQAPLGRGELLQATVRQSSVTKLGTERRSVRREKERTSLRADTTSACTDSLSLASLSTASSSFCSASTCRSLSSSSSSSWNTWAPSC